MSPTVIVRQGLFLFGQMLVGPRVDSALVPSMPASDVRSGFVRLSAV